MFIIKTRWCLLSMKESKDVRGLIGKLVKSIHWSLEQG